MLPKTFRYTGGWIEARFWPCEPLPNITQSSHLSTRALRLSATLLVFSRFGEHPLLPPRAFALNLKPPRHQFSKGVNPAYFNPASSLLFNLTQALPAISQSKMLHINIKNRNIRLDFGHVTPIVGPKLWQLYKLLDFANNFSVDKYSYWFCGIKCCVNHGQELVSLFSRTLVEKRRGVNAAAVAAYHLK